MNVESCDTAIHGETRRLTKDRENTRVLCAIVLSDSHKGRRKRKTERDREKNGDGVTGGGQKRAAYP